MSDLRVTKYEDLPQHVSAEHFEKCSDLKELIHKPRPKTEKEICWYHQSHYE